MQGTLGSRQTPAPRSQRLVVGSHTPEQQSAPAAHPSPVRRHAVWSVTQRLWSHLNEQQSVS